MVGRQKAKLTIVESKRFCNRNETQNDSLWLILIRINVTACVIRFCYYNSIVWFRMVDLVIVTQFYVTGLS